MKQIIGVVLGMFLAFSLQAQTGTAYGLKGGLVLGNQSWNGQEREIMLGYQGDVFLESVNDSISLSFYASLGYHQRGSSFRIRSYYDPNLMREIPGRSIRQPFSNVSLQVGAKNRHNINEGFTGYYGLGIRLEYTVDYELVFVSDGFDNYVNRFNYGFSVLAGIEFEFPNFPGALLLEASIHPDISKQIFLPGNTIEYYNPYTNSYFLYPEQKVFNRSLEITIGYKFIRRVEWVD